MDNLPLGFGMALSQNVEAMQYFATQSESKKQEIVDGTHKIESPQEMYNYVASLGKTATWSKMVPINKNAFELYANTALA